MRVNVQTEWLLEQTEIFDKLREAGDKDAIKNWYRKFNPKYEELKAYHKEVEAIDAEGKELLSKFDKLLSESSVQAEQAVSEPPVPLAPFDGQELQRPDEKQLREVLKGQWTDGKPIRMEEVSKALVNVAEETTPELFARLS